MYNIFADSDVLYSPDLIEDGCIVISPKLTMELNKSGSLQFLIPPQNPLYGRLQKLKTIITLMQDDDQVWRGRVLQDERDFYNRRKMFCEGQLSFLLDSVMRPYSYTGTIRNYLNKFLTSHNEQVEEAKQFQLGTVTVEDSNDNIVRSTKEYKQTMDELMEKLPNSSLGGYITTTPLSNGKTAINYLADPGEECDQTILFGENLLDLTEYIDAENVFTVLIPLGAKKTETDENGNETELDERVTIEDVNGGLDYIEDETAIGLFGRIVRTETWDDVTISSNLITKGKAFLAEGIKMAVTLTVRAIDLHLIDVDTEKIKLGSHVRVVSEPHGLDSYFLCTKIELDLLNPENSTYTLGYGFKAMTERQVAAEKLASSAASTASAANTAASNASTAANSATNTAENAASTAENAASTAENANTTANNFWSWFPTITEEDEGKTLKIVDGKWTLV